MNPGPHPLSEPWRDHLAALPEVDPPAALWQRLRDAQSVPQPKIRQRWPWAMAAAAVLAVTIVSWPRPETASVDPVASVPAASELLAPAPTGVDQNLRILDQELTLAYARQADEAEIQALWATRERLLASASESSAPMLARL